MKNLKETLSELLGLNFVQIFKGNECIASGGYVEIFMYCPKELLYSDVEKLTIIKEKDGMLSYAVISIKEDK